MVPETGLAVRIELLPDGDVAGAAPGEHAVFEAASGSLLHALRLRDSFFALRCGRIQTFQVSRKLPSASLVRYPPPFAPTSEVERAQVLERAESFIGLEPDQVRRHLVQAGMDEHVECEALLAESLMTFCVTGMCRCWHVGEAHKLARLPRALEQPKVLDTQIRCPDDVSNMDSDSAGNRNALNGSKPATSTNGTPGLQNLPDKLQEKALSTAIHMGCRGPAARAAGAAAAMTVEGYALYKEIGKHCELHEAKNISSDQLTERVCESTVSSSGRAMGSLAGAALGQASIPVPVVGAVIGGVAGAACGGFYANSLVRGAWRLSGGKAKGGEDIVRCVEHAPEDRATTVKEDSRLAHAESCGHSDDLL